MLALLQGQEEDHIQIVLSGYAGLAVTPRADLTLERAGGTNLTFRDVAWEDASFRSPQYYGLRLGVFLGRRSPWGLMLDFTHAKIIAEDDEEVAVVGTRDGAAVDADERIDRTLESLDITHGLNFLTVNIVHRWLFDPETFLGRFEPYVGAGGGIAIPHVEASIGGESDHGYQTDGPAFQALAGLSATLVGPLAVFVEYKISVAFLNRLEVPGGTISLEPWTHHLVVGISLRIW